MTEIVERARYLIKSSYSSTPCNQLCNYAWYGSKTGGGNKLAKAWAQLPGVAAFPGCVIVGTDGKHCGIWTGQDSIVHSSFSLDRVEEVNASQAKYIFPQGYKFVRG